MLNKTFFLAVVMTVLLVLPCAAESIEGLSLHVQKIEPGVVRVWVGDYISSTAVCAIATRKGIVVIDTTNIPKLDQAFRKVIAKELGRSDFKYLINTHGHGDHTHGNGVYADCRIIAHEGVTARMWENLKDVPRLIAWNKEAVQEQKDQIASGKLNDTQKAVAAEQLIISTLTGEFLNSAPRPTYPTKTFRDKLVLDCGDVTLELYQSGGTHTRSDIFILVPQKGILFTGDMMADKWLSDTPGCLATFAIQSGTMADYPVLVKNWQSLIDRQNEIKHYIPGHWNGELSFVGFQNRFNYLKTMLADMETLVKSRGDFNQFRADYSLKNKFPHLVGSPGMTAQGHQMSINHLFQVFSGRIGLSAALQGPIMDNRFAEEFPALKADILKSREKYFFTEADLIGLGYFLMQQLKKSDNAVEMFQLCVELFPDSWNAFDSLAEAYYTKGDMQKALELYRKSLELNPNNENGKKFIERIEQELAK
ncbi:MAG: MBL fold metallo-hydrolase [Candidatus Aminicenantes bacterium]|nr:MBL fold metallo-hydrolase [Candidatus Aminicenantes bacterium]